MSNKFYYDLDKTNSRYERSEQGQEQQTEQEQKKQLEQLEQLEKINQEQKQQKQSESKMETSETIINDMGCWSSIKTMWQYCKNLVYRNNGEYIGRVMEVVPTEYVNKLAIYQGKCYHEIKMNDGTKFMLIFSHVKFCDIEKHIKPGCFVKIVYNKTSNKVINIYPQPFFRYMTYEDFLDYNDIDNDAVVKICYLEGHIKRIDILGIPLTDVTDTNDSLYTESNQTELTDDNIHKKEHITIDIKENEEERKTK